jgi:hypothetical protein
MRIDGHACSETGMTPFQETLFGDGTINELQRMFLSKPKPFITKSETVRDGVLLEITVPWVAYFGCMNLKINRSRHWETLIDGGLKVSFQGQSDGFRNDQSAQDEYRLDRVPQVSARLAGFIQVNQVHG